MGLAVYADPDGLEQLREEAEEAAREAAQEVGEHLCRTMTSEEIEAMIRSENDHQGGDESPRERSDGPSRLEGHGGFQFMIHLLRGWGVDMLGRCRLRLGLGAARQRWCRSSRTCRLTAAHPLGGAPVPACPRAVDASRAHPFVDRRTPVSQARPFRGRARFATTSSHLRMFDAPVRTDHVARIAVAVTTRFAERLQFSAHGVDRRDLEIAVRRVGIFRGGE